MKNLKQKNKQYRTISSLIFSAILSTVSSIASAEESSIKVPSEVIDIGFTGGVINLEDFPSEFLSGVNINFKASEDFFLQYNYVQATISQAQFEKSQFSTVLNLGDDREFKHYDLLLGYNLFHSEFFTGYNNAKLATFYLVGGIGDTDFGEEKNFSYTFGLGMQVEFFHKFIMRVDYRNYMYKSALIVGEEEDVSHNTQFSTSLNYLF